MVTVLKPHALQTAADIRELIAELTRMAEFLEGFGEGKTPVSSTWNNQAPDCTTLHRNAPDGASAPKTTPKQLRDRLYEFVLSQPPGAVWTKMQLGEVLGISGQTLKNLLWVETQKGCIQSIRRNAYMRQQGDGVATRYAHFRTEMETGEVS